MRTIIVDTLQGQFLLENVPDDAKITFGAMQPNAKKYDYERKGFGLRIWKTKDQQLAAFSDVISFRDSALVVKRKQSVTKHNVSGTYGPDGQRVDNASVTVEAWVSDDLNTSSVPELTAAADDKLDILLED